MENLAKITPQQPMTLQKLSHEITTDTNKLSLYKNDKVTPEVLAQCFITLKKAFPKLTKGWYDILEEMLIDESFSNERLIDATKNLVRTCQYPEPTIANMLSFNKEVKIFTYSEVCEHNIWAYVDSIDIGIKDVRYVKKEYSKYFKKWEVK